MIAKIESGSDRFGNDSCWVDVYGASIEHVSEVLERLPVAYVVVESSAVGGCVIVEPVSDAELESHEQFRASLADIELAIAALDNEHAYALARAAGWNITASEADDEWAGLWTTGRKLWRDACDAFDAARSAL